MKLDYLPNNVNAVDQTKSETSIYFTVSVVTSREIYLDGKRYILYSFDYF